MPPKKEREEKLVGNFTRARLEANVDIPHVCPGGLLPCGCDVWVGEQLFIYTVNRFSRKDRTKDQVVPCGQRWKCMRCGRVQMTADLEEPHVRPESAPGSDEGRGPVPE